MTRIQIPNKIREFVRWSQKDICLLCSFPLVLYCHLHHVISVKDFGPEDEFNLVGLCSNHHGMIENLRKTETPSLSKLGTTDPKVRKWAYKMHPAMKMFDDLNSQRQKLVNLFLSPYPNSSNQVLSKLFQNNEPHTNVAIARMLIDKNVKLLKEINQQRPRIYFQKPTLSKLITDFDPYDLMLLEETTAQEAIDTIVDTMQNKIADDIFDFSIAQQFIKLKFTHFLDEKGMINIAFSDKLIFTIKKLREMSDNECFNLREN